MTISSIQAGKIICELSGWETSTLRLQKLLYISQLFYVGEKTGRLIREDFEAWKFGPVEPKLYRYCRGYGSDYIPNIFPMDVGVNGDDPEYKFLKTITMAMQGGNGRKRITEAKLVSYTHRDGGAWDIIRNVEKKVIIPYELIENEYKEKIEES